MIHRKKNRTLDRVAMGAAIGMPIMTLPQLLEVIEGNTEGVSLLTWSLYTIISFIFALLGFKHKEKALIVAYVPMFIIELAIIVGLIMPVVH